jgi:hypothetical protein
MRIAGVWGPSGTFSAICSSGAPEGQGSVPACEPVFQERRRKVLGFDLKKMEKLGS